MLKKLDLSFRVFSGGKRVHKEHKGAMVNDFDEVLPKFRAHIANSFPQINQAQVTNERKQPQIGSWEVEMVNQTEGMTFKLDMDKI